MLVVELPAMVCNCDRPERRVIDDRIIVNVESVDWSEHPSWSGDFDASEMQVESLDAVPEWAGDPVPVESSNVCEVCGSQRVNREPL